MIKKFYFEKGSSIFRIFKNVSFATINKEFSLHELINGFNILFTRAMQIN